MCNFDWAADGRAVGGYPQRGLAAFNRGRLPERQATLSSPLTPVPGAVEIEIDDRGGVERQDLADDQPAEDGNAQRLAKLAALAETDHQWHRAEQCGHGGHHDPPEAPHAS